MTRDHQRELLARACIGEVSPEDAVRLLDACRRDPAVLAEFSRLATVERLLAHCHLYPDDGAFVREVRARLEPSAPSQAPLPLPWIRGRQPWAWAAAAGIALLAIATFWIAQPRPVAARIVRIESVAWPAGPRPPQAGESLRAGRLRFDSGLLELQFAQGATAIVEGPADFEVRGPHHAILHQGRAVTRVTKAARGFILDGPRGRLLDLGTEFGVNVGASGDMEVHVLEGLVEATPSGQDQSLHLAENQAVRLSHQAVERFAADATEFVTDLPPYQAGAIACLHWSFDEGQGAVSINRGIGLGAAQAGAYLRSFPAGAPGPQWIPGQFGGGLFLDGQDDFVECEFPGISGGQPRTVAFWVKVPRSFQTHEGYGVVNWGTIAKPGMAWQISINPEERSGPIGRLRVGVHLGWVVGTTDLRDDHWHHCAVVMYGGRHPDAGTHILLYVDGELEPAARKAVREIRTDTAGALAHNMWLGRNLAFQTPASQVAGGPFFRGCVDEVFIGNAALDQDQLRSLMKHNRLPDPSPEGLRTSAP